MDGWAPVLPRSSDAGRRAYETALALGDALLREADADLATRNRPAEPRDVDAVVLFAQLSLAEGERGTRWRRAAIRHLNAAIDGADALCAAGRFGLHGGLAGLGWVVEHVAALLSAGEEPDLDRDTDEALVRELQRGRCRGPRGLPDGLAGLGVYFLERPPAPSAREGVGLVIAHLNALGPEGPELDTARGAPAVIHFLSEAAAAGFATAGAPLADALGWLASRLEASPPTAPPGWCGVLGAAAVLLQVARHTGREDCLDLGRRLLDHSLDRLAAPGPAPDPRTAHTLGRICQVEDDPRCRERAKTWLESLAQRPIEADATRDGAGAGLLEGRAGAALALLAGTTDVEPAWDRRILVSGRRTRR